jgi:hypothetical protein
MIQIATLLARPLLGKLPVSDEAKGKISAVTNLLKGGTGDSWVPLGRQQATLPFSGQARAASATSAQGEVGLEGKPIRWRQFDWPADQKVDDCTLHRIRWRFYQNGLISLEVIASKDRSGLDMSDLIGHAIELRDKTGFLIGVWSAAFLVHKGTERLAFQSSLVDDFLPLKLHFDEVAPEQDGLSFRI